jgi:protein-L-isoaspartate(D-aspartate) O-methyltransferase
MYIPDDTYKHKGLRKKLVEEVAAKGVHDQKILQVMEKVPRHFFMPDLVDQAYIDKAYPIAAGQTISQPYTVAFQTQLLDVMKGHKVLEIGTGSGYQTAILMELGAKVFSVERQRELYIKTAAFLPRIGYQPHLFFGDGYLGVPAFAPYDRILITAAAPVLPEELLKQLKTGGKLVVPFGEQKLQKMLLVEKIADNEFKKSEHGDFVFVPLLKGKSHTQ